MQLGDTRAAYGWISIALHWISAIGVITMWLLGQRIGWAPDRDARIDAIWFHVAIGTFLWVFFFARIVWRLTQPLAERPKQHWSLNVLSYIVQYGLIAAIAVMIVTGPLTVFTLGRGISPFGLFTIPSPFAERNGELHELFENIHIFVANLLLPLVALHVLGGLKHLIFDRDGVFQRILWVRKVKTLAANETLPRERGEGPKGTAA